jgi:ribosome-associated translation inhibitor RaiA
MILTAQIQDKAYHITITIESKSLHAHSMMSDYKEFIEVAIDELREELTKYVEESRRKYEGDN